MVFFDNQTLPRLPLISQGNPTLKKLKFDEQIFKYQGAKLGSVLGPYVDKDPALLDVTASLHSHQVIL